MERHEYLIGVAIVWLGQALDRMQQTAPGVVLLRQPEQILLTRRSGERLPIPSASSTQIRFLVHTTALRGNDILGVDSYTAALLRAYPD